MPEPFTPTVEELWDVALYGAEQATAESDRELDEAEFRAQFDRAIARIRADTLREAADDKQVKMFSPAVYIGNTPLKVTTTVAEWLRARAEQEASE